MANSKNNGPVNHGLPFGSMKPPVGLATAITGQATLEQRLILNREEIKRQTGTFYKAFKVKFPKAGLADFARQFDKNVPFKRDDYRRNAMYIAIDNMFRYMPEVKTGGKPESESAKAARIAKAKAERAKNVRAKKAQANRAIRLAVAIANQIGIPSSLFLIAGQRIGFKASEIEAMLADKTALVDIGLGTYQLTVRKTGEPATAQVAKSNVKLQNAAKSVPTAAEVANAAKSGPQVIVEKPVTPAPVYKGKGQYVRTLKPVDNVSSPAVK